jgi:hypothetical protein
MRLFADPIPAIESDLTGTVLVLGNEKIQVAIIATDLCVMSAPEAARIRKQVGDAIGTPASHVMLNLSHNHSAPGLPDYIEDPMPEKNAIRKMYEKDLTRWLVDAATEAAQNLQPARIGADWGECRIGVYRREIRPDGKDVLGEVPDHPIDPSVGVVRVDDLDGHPIAILFRYGCHPVTMGPRAMVASTDFPGPARQVIEQALGGTAMFLQGCGGNINPVAGIGYEVDCREQKNRLGFTLGGEAVKVAANIRTNVRAGKRVPLGNIPNILFTPWVPVEGETCIFLGATEEIVKLEFDQLPTLEQAEEIRTKWKKTLADRQTNGAQDWEIRVAIRFAEWSEKLVQAVRNGHPTADLTAQVIRVNDIVFAGLNAEIFYETGMTIRGKSPFKDTFVMGYTNGSISYLPRAEDYPKGGWKINESYALPDLLFQGYSQPVAFHPKSEQVTVDRTVGLIQRLG